MDDRSTRLDNAAHRAIVAAKGGDASESPEVIHARVKAVLVDVVLEEVERVIEQIREAIADEFPEESEADE